MQQNNMNSPKNSKSVVTPKNVGLTPKNNQAGKGMFRATNTALSPKFVTPVKAASAAGQTAAGKVGVGANGGQEGKGGGYPDVPKLKIPHTLHVNVPVSPRASDREEEDREVNTLIYMYMYMYIYV